ncbi:heme anaerobic degradation radical SAM methyltransferase ChuW/HutW [Photobacterium kishitanii]|uniref:Heme anaerobic degradation radical SAM methyltransferase ChuW/HutW n=1 Tax=Photobacterium kishitanii TaxID=318456 RepID=A0AAX0YUA1_9GAMM|nr:heme anaerobic degradation radical SAM methyltransferase ChuW/HutW [Photobacterium kishitanii]PSW51685.1 heme anaerobic degradation radical SAM methyltransferase ChuW/HutW [Photobacterium kishitanii]PSW62493.1 heme anaerobic degradation radical SAM methyltransferase ChuW/HutW [Photobacterium kishitanii]PSX19586.1 heme anaerobic degradation radical SAM methyltransferase ChuW/HutW [Photobacterium kishitanii]PSX28661.1 heme anaerobic degradation radical SAM methyltransferase ChuW/HutW [Photobac
MINAEQLILPVNVPAILDTSVFESDILGENTPDPLRFGFRRKLSAHAGGSGHAPIASEQIQPLAEQVLQLTTPPLNKRCLYVHIPFCRVRCTYCSFFEYASSQRLIDDYFAALMVELKYKAAQPWTQAAPFQAVYIGGGTPTDLTAAQIKQLGTMIRQYFPLATDCELTLEGRINRFSDEMFESALEGGFNRFSFGVQSFDTQVRRQAKRLDDRDVVLKRISELAATDQAPIVIDLLYGLPYQSIDVWQQDLEDFLDSGAHGVDLYQLIEMGNTPMGKMVEQGRLPEPADTMTKASMFEIGVDYMAKHHLRRLSVNHWARDNRERSCYNSLAKTTAEVLPLGAGAGGNVGGYGFMQHRKLERYMDDVSNQRVPFAMMVKSAPNAAINTVIKAGFDRGVIIAKELDKQAGWSLFRYCLPLFQQWQKNGLVVLEQQGSHRYLNLTLAGQFWSVTLAQALIQVITTAVVKAQPQPCVN